MAAIRSRATPLLFMLLAILSNQLVKGAPADGTSLKKAAFGGIPRKILQGPSGSTVFGNPPPGTMVVTWNLIPAKTVGGQYPYGNGAQPPPYQYDWFNLVPANCAGCANIIFYPVSAYLAGPGGQQTQLTSTGGCNIPDPVPDVSTLFMSCTGTFAVPNNGTATVSQIWDFLQLPPGLEFQLPTPFNGFNCTFFLDGPAPVYPDANSLVTTFDNGQTIPLEPSTLSTLTSLFGNVGFHSQPYTQQGTLTFQSINLRVNYNPPVLLTYPVYWFFGYSYCVFDSTQLTVQTVPQPNQGSTCDPQSVNSNQCYGSNGDKFVCCPGNCGPPGPIPTCEHKVCSSPGAKSKGGTCDSNSANPNQCFNEDGSCYVCCPGSCGKSGPDGPTCNA